MGCFCYSLYNQYPDHLSNKIYFSNNLLKHVANYKIFNLKSSQGHCCYARTHFIMKILNFDFNFYFKEYSSKVADFQILNIPDENSYVLTKYWNEFFKCQTTHNLHTLSTADISYERHHVTRCYLHLIHCERYAAQLLRSTLKCSFEKNTI